VFGFTTDENFSVFDDIRAAMADVTSDVEWITSILTERTQQKLAYNDELSSIQSVLFGVPLRSVL